LQHGYVAFESYGPCSVDKALTTVQRDALPIDDLRAGDRIWNITTQTLQVWNGTAWVDIGGAGGIGHEGIDGETGTIPNFEDHDTYDTSWMWNYQNSFVNSSLSQNGPDWFGNMWGGGEGPTFSPMGNCIIDPSTGGISPIGLDSGFTDSGVMRNILVSAPGATPWTTQHLMVKGMSLSTGFPWIPEGFNVVIGFASQPFQGLYSANHDTFNEGVFFAAATDLALVANGLTLIGATPDPLGDDWYACIRSGIWVYAITTGVPVVEYVKHKFHLEWHDSNTTPPSDARVLFYIDDVLKNTVSSTDAGLAWPTSGIFYPTVGMSNTTTPIEEYLTMSATGYQNCVVGDIGSSVRVTGMGTMNMGSLIAFNNNLPPSWTVQPEFSNLMYGQGTMVQLTGVFTPLVPPGWTAHILIGRTVTIDGVSYAITDNDGVSLTVAVPPVNGTYDWTLPLMVGDECYINPGGLGHGKGTVTNADFVITNLYPEFFLPWIHATSYTPDTPPPPI